MSMQAINQVPPLSRQMRSAAETLAAQIESGVFAGVSADTRCDLRNLSLEMAAWGEDATELEERLRPPNSRSVRRSSAIGRLMRRLRLGRG